MENGNFLGSSVSTNLRQILAWLNGTSRSNRRSLEEVRKHDRSVRSESERAAAKCLRVPRTERSRKVDNNSNGARSPASYPGCNIAFWTSFGDGASCPT